MPGGARAGAIRPALARRPPAAPRLGGPPEGALCSRRSSGAPSNPSFVLFALSALFTSRPCLIFRPRSSVIFTLSDLSIAAAALRTTRPGAALVVDLSTYHQWQRLQAGHMRRIPARRIATTGRPQLRGNEYFYCVI